MTFLLDPSIWADSLLFAAGGGDKLTPNLSFLLQGFFFFASYLVLKRVLFPPVLKVITERQKRIELAHKQLKELEEEGQELEREYNAKIRDARMKAQEIHNEARKESGDRESEILEKARKESAQSLYENATKLEKERKEVLKKFDEESEQMAQDIASKLLGRSVS